MREMVSGQKPEDFRGKLRGDIARGETSEPDRKTLIGMSHIIEARGKIRHSDVAPGRETGEVGEGQTNMSIVRPVNEREGKSVASSLEKVGAGGGMVAKVFMQDRADGEPACLEGGRRSQLVAVISAKRLGSLPPGGWIVIWRVGHADRCRKRRHE
jgi:hypothetical protein